MTGTYKAREVIALVPTEHSAAHLEKDGIAKKQAMARQAMKKRGSVEK
jgi:hypothetical protein